MIGIRLTLGVVTNIRGCGCEAQALGRGARSAQKFVLGFEEIDGFRVHNQLVCSKAKCLEATRQLEFILR